MRLKCLSCEALARMVYFHSAFSPHMVDVEIIKLGLHNTPDILRQTLQSRIDQALAGSVAYDAVVMAYGLCGKATHGLQARGIPIVVPRAHDCITLFLGSRERYKDQFENRPGTYWYALDYLQRNDNKSTVLSLGASEVENNLQDTYQTYVEKYGLDNADYLMGIMGSWQSHYQRAAYVDMGIGDGSAAEHKARDDASNRGWTFEHMQGDSRLIKNLIYGEWEKDFLILKPGEKLKMTYDEGIIGPERP
jgi:hypothetical protein